MPDAPDPYGSLAKLTPDQWRALLKAIEPMYRRAFKMCERCVELGLSPSDPLYHQCGKLLRACIDVRRLAEAALAGEPAPEIKEASLSMMHWVLPHCGGGVVPGVMRKGRG